jgi:uncharacterized Zn-finger protein
MKKIEKNILVGTYEGCKREYLYKHDLQNHLKRHENSETWTCTNVGCGNFFKRKQYLAAHMKVHENSVELTCTFVGCNKVSSSKWALQKHLKTGKQEKNFMQFRWLRQILSTVARIKGTFGNSCSKLCSKTISM